MNLPYGHQSYLDTKALLEAEIEDMKTYPHFFLYTNSEAIDDVTEKFYREYDKHKDYFYAPQAFAEHGIFWRGELENGWLKEEHLESKPIQIEIRYRKDGNFEVEAGWGDYAITLCVETYEDHSAKEALLKFLEHNLAEYVKEEALEVLISDSPSEESKNILFNLQNDYLHAMRKRK